MSDDEPTLRVVPIREHLDRCASDALKALWRRNVYSSEDVVIVGRVLPVEPTSAEWDDLAVRLSNAMEDVGRLAVDAGVELSVLAAPMSIPILDRAELKTHADTHYGHSLFTTPVVNGRELLCVFYLAVPTWRGWERPGSVLPQAERSRPRSTTVRSRDPARGLSTAHVPRMC